MSERRLAWMAGTLALVLYAATWSPVVTWAHFGEDGPELETVGRTLGVAHPTGYPLFTLLVRVAGLLAPPPWAAVNLVSLLAAAAAVGFLALAGRRLAARAFPSSGAAWVGGVVSAAVLAVSLTWWRQAVIGEVYTLHILLVAAVCALLFRGAPRDRLLAAYLLGLGLAHHLQMLPFLLVVLVYLLASGAARPRPATVLAFLAPLTLYAVLLVRAGRDPAMNWGDPHSLRNLWWSLSGTPYRGNLLHDGIGAAVSRWIQALGPGALEQLGTAGAILAVLGLAVAIRRVRAAAAALLLLYVGTAGVAAAYAIPDPAAYILPATVAAALLAGLGATALAARVQAAVRPRVRLATAAALAGALAAAFAAQGARVGSGASARGDDAGFRFAQDGASLVEDGALVLAHGDGRAFSLWYGTTVLRPAPGTAVLYDNLLDWGWYRNQVQQRHPWIRLPDTPLSRVPRYRALIDGQLGHRPVYVTELPPILETRYRLVPCGPLYRVLPRPAGRVPTGGASSGTTDRGGRSRSG